MLHSGQSPKMSYNAIDLSVPTCRYTLSEDLGIEFYIIMHKTSLLSMTKQCETDLK